MNALNVLKKAVAVALTDKDVESGGNNAELRRLENKILEMQIALGEMETAQKATARKLESALKEKTKDSREPQQTSKELQSLCDTRSEEVKYLYETKKLQHKTIKASEQLQVLIREGAANMKRLAATYEVGQVKLLRQKQQHEAEMQKLKSQNERRVSEVVQPTLNFLHTLVSDVTQSMSVARKKLESHLATTVASLEATKQSLDHVEARNCAAVEKLKLDHKKKVASMTESLRSLEEDCAALIVSMFREMSCSMSLLVQCDQPFRTHHDYNAVRNGAIMWYWEEGTSFVGPKGGCSVVLNNKCYVPYTRYLSHKIEFGYQRFIAEPARFLYLAIEITGKTHNVRTGSLYWIDFNAFTQQNATSGYKRKIFRADVQNWAQGLPAIPPTDENEFELLPVSTGQLVQAIKIHDSFEWMQCNLLQSSSDPRSGWLPIGITRAFTPQELIKRTLADYSVPPSTWNEPHGVSFNVLSPESTEYSEVKNFFLHSMGATIVNISAIRRIQNLGLWKCYAAKKASMHLKPDQGMHNFVHNNTSSVENCWLFHGTSGNSVNKIVYHGFNRAFAYSRNGNYGAGVYFARDSSYSYHYTHPDHGNLNMRYIFLCHVLVGDWCQGRPGMLVPDAKPHNEMELFDTAVDNVGSPTQYVIFHDSQAYPEYLVSFSG